MPLPALAGDWLGFRAGWICANEVEFKAAKAMLEYFHGELEDPHLGNHTRFTLGQIGCWGVVIGRMPQDKENTQGAAMVLSDMKALFFNLKVIFLVGTGTGIPDPPVSDVRLGDVVVGWADALNLGVIEYGVDFDQDGKLEKFKVHKIKTLEPGDEMRLAILNLLERQDGKMTDYLDEMARRHPTLEDMTIHPGSAFDCLRDPRIGHEIKRPNRPLVPFVHFGTVASSDIVDHSADIRNGLRRQFQALCVDRQAAGLDNTLPTMVIRGICDYGDGESKAIWSGYAAASAAVYAKALIEQVAAADLVLARRSV